MSVRELRAVLEGWLAAGDEPIILATVVETSGSTYRRAGARMLITRDRWIAGSISGGCLESDLMQNAWDRTAAGPALVTYDATADGDIVWGFGLGCNGVVRVLLERLGQVDASLSKLDQCVQIDKCCHIATVINDGPDLGKRIVVEPGDGSGGWMGGILDVAPLHESGWEIRQIEDVRVLIEAIEPRLKLVIFGAGHDVLPLVRFAKELDWHVTIADWRDDLATRDRFAGADAIFSRPLDGLVADVELDERSYAVVMTHNYLNDLAILRQLAATNVPYIGLLGPPARRDRILQELGNPDLGDRLHGPVGLDIGAEGPEEIALSIVAEILAVEAGVKNEGGCVQPFGVIVLAAGSSSRLGQPKQLLPYRGSTLVRHAAESALQVGAQEVIVVVGAEAEKTTEALTGLLVKIAHNSDWQTGMASSIRAGIDALSDQIAAVTISLVDQPLVTAEHLRSLAERQAKTGTRIVASSYNGTSGVPAAFDRSVFPELRSLAGDKGARELIRQGSPDLIDCPEAAIDIDTASAFEALEQA